MLFGMLAMVAEIESERRPVPARARLRDRATPSRRGHRQPLSGPARGRASPCATRAQRKQRTGKLPGRL